MSGTELDVVLERLREAQDPRAELVALALRQLAEEDAELAQIARLAALPRRLDRGIVGALRGGDPDPQRDEALLDRLMGLSFIDSSRPERPGYHDSVRAVLLDELRAEGPWRARFEQASGRLWALHGQRTSAAFKGFLDVKTVASPLRRANPDRLARVADAAERALLEPALERLYHAVLFDGTAGCESFESLYDWAESARLLLVCRALRAAVEENLRSFAPEEYERRGPWLRYWDGRLAAYLRDGEAAEAAFRDALARTTDGRLRTKALGSLATLLSDGFRLGEALAIARERLALARADGESVDELDALFGIVDLEIRLGRLTAVLATAEELASVAGRNDNTMMVVFAHAMAGLVAMDLGRRDDARRRFFAALDEARKAEARQIAAERVVADALARLCRRDHLRVAITARTETELVGDGEPATRDEAADRAAMADSLIDAGLLRMARDVLAVPLADAELASRVDVLTAVARLRNAAGELPPALATWIEIMGLQGDQAPNPEKAVLALANAADLEARLGQADDARQHLVMAAETAERLGHRPLVGIVEVIRARLAIDAGRLDEAEELLAAALPEVEGAPRYLLDHRVTIGRLALRRGDHASALEAYRESFALAVGLDMPERAAIAAAEAGLVAADLADWDLAGAAAEQAAAHARLLAERAAMTMDPDQQANDRLHAAGIRAFYGVPLSEADDIPLELLDDPPVSLLAECIRREPDHVLYRLGLAYAHVHRQSWGAAADEFEAALDHAPELMEGTVIAERPVICRLLESDRRLRDEDAQGALDQLDRAAARAADHADLRVAIALRRADALVRAERFEEAEREYRHLADPSGNDASPAAGAIALSRGGALRALDGDAEGARSAWRAALDAFRAMGVESPYWSLLRECSMLGPPVTRSPDVRRLLRELRDEPSTGGPMQTFRPRLRAEVPETWFAKESVTFLAPDGQANVIASSEPLDPSIDTERYASTQGDLLAKEFPGYEQHELRDTELLGGRQGVFRHFSWLPPDGVRVTQMQLYFAEPGRGYTATATTPSERFPELELVLHQVLEGLTIEPAQPEPGAAP